MNLSVHVIRASDNNAADAAIGSPARVPVGRRGDPPGCYFICSLLLSMLVIGLVAAVCLSNSEYRPLPAIGLGFMCFAHALISAHGGTYAYLASIPSASDDTVSDEIERLRLEPGRIFIKCECSQFISSTDMDGNTVQSIWVSFYNRTYVPIDVWIDVSDPLPEWEIGAPEIRKISTETEFEFANPESAEFTGRLVALVRQAHRHRSGHCQVACELEVPGILPRMLMFPHKQAAPWWVSLFWYFAASFLLFGWSYRLLLEACSTRVCVCVRKRYTFNVDTLPEVNMLDERHIYDFV